MSKRRGFPDERLVAVTTRSAMLPQVRIAPEMPKMGTAARNSMLAKLKTKPAPIVTT